jgi:hypothetical protein
MSPLLALPVLALGCTGPDTPPIDDGTTTDQVLSASYGGQSTSDEAPLFNDPTLLAPELSAEDPAVSDATGAALASEPGRLRILVAWGYLKPDPQATEVVDWSGSITVANGALRVVRTVRFEPATDMVIRPRTDIHTVEFTSKTRPAADGLLLEVATGPKLDPTNGSVTLTFASAPITNTQTLVVGERLSEVVPVDAAGHVLVYHVVRPDADGCTEGFLRGQWKHVTTLAGRDIGVFRGRIGGGDGSLEGSVKGVFGQRKDGASLFFGKVIDKDGKFVAVLAGAYGDGVFKGRILVGADVKDLQIDGRVHGRYADKDMNAADGAGGFIGRWSRKCGEDPAEGSAMTSDSEPPGVDGDSSSS